MRVENAAYRLPLLSTMARDLNARGSLRTTTAAAMWATQRSPAGVWPEKRGTPPIPIGAARVTGATLVATGAGLCIAGMGRFTGAQELTGTRNQALTTNGIYGYSRNP